MTAAKAIVLKYLVDGDNDLEEDMEDYDSEVEDYVDDFNDSAQYIKVYP
jgi:hypothetical protein